MAEEMREAAGEDEQELAAEMAGAFLSENLPENVFGAPKAGAGMWASCIRVLDPINGETVQQIPLEQNEAALSICLVRFAGHPEATFCLVGVAKDYQLNPRRAEGGFIYTYRIHRSAGPAALVLELVHKTSLEEIPYAMCAFQGKVLVGVKNLLRLYDLGKKKLLRKSENKHIPNMVVGIQTYGDRIIVSDVQESVHFLRYRRAENQLVIFADDTTPRWVTVTCMLDFSTVAIADKFGNISIVRLPQNVNDNVDEDPTGTKSLWDRGLLSGASQKSECISVFHIGETILSIQKANLIPGGNDSLVYTTLSGTVGMLVPFSSHEDQDFFQHLEMHMRAENPPLAGRDHLAYRSSYYPVKNVIDGDLCEQYNTLDPAKLASIADELDGKTPAEVSKKLEDIRTRYAF